MNLTYSSTFENIPNPICKNHIIQVWSHLKQSTPWALRMVDSTAKLPVGLMTGNLINFGHVDECTTINVEEDFGSFTGKHCMVQIPLLGTSSRFTYKSGVCIPSSCSAEDLENFLKHLLHMTIKVDDLQCHTLTSSKPYEGKEIFTLIIISLLISLVILSTLYDHFSKGNKNILLQSFSLKKNVKNLLDTDGPPGPLDFLYGLKFGCIGIVILGHVYMSKFVIPSDINRTHILNWLSDWDHVWLTSRGLVIDIFFVMGGLLSSYTFLKNRDQGRRFNLLSYWIHRYMRMAPAMAMQLLFEATLMNRLNSGPNWKAYALRSEESCKKNWWKFLLFINNWWGDEGCLDHAWYIAADMQISLLAPLFLVPLYRKPRTGLMLTLAALVVAFCTSFGVSFGYEERVTITEDFKSPMQRLLFRGTYNRIVPWLIGLIVGYFFHKYKYKQATSFGHKSSKTISERCGKCLFGAIFWIASATITLSACFAVHPLIQPDSVYNAFETASYLSVSHFVTGVGTAIALVLCWIGYGGPFNMFFSWRLFLPLSKLSYSMYMIHFVIIRVRLVDVKATTYLSDYDLFMLCSSLMLITTFLSPIMYLMVEHPFSVIEMAVQLRVTSGNPKPKPEPKTLYGTLQVAQAKFGNYDKTTVNSSNTCSSKKLEGITKF